MAEFLIGDRSFRRKADAEDFIRIVRDRIRDTTIVTEEDDDFLRDLLALHPDAEAKVGAGVKTFTVRQNYGNTEGFWILRTDGSNTDFSFKKCLFGASQEAKVRSAMRHAVIGQIQEARDDAFGLAVSILCPITNVEINRASCHIDHYEPSFLQLANEFAAESGGYDAILTEAADRNIGRRFVDADLQNRWCDYHRGRARLRAVSKAANLSILRRTVQPSN